MKTDTILRKLYRDKKEFVTSKVIKEYCGSIGLNYDTAMRHFIPRGYLVRIFKGIFYVKSPEEVTLGRVKYSPLKLVSKGLELKGVKNWYFGLYTALKLNNITHEHFAVEHVVNDRIFRASPVRIAGHKFKFLKIKPSLLSFGLVKDDLRYSDPEKTILDFIYIWRYNGIPEKKIVMDISEWATNLSSYKITNYAKKYPKGVGRVIEKVIR